MCERRLSITVCDQIEGDFEVMTAEEPETLERLEPPLVVARYRRK